MGEASWKPLPGKSLPALMQQSRCRGSWPLVTPALLIPHPSAPPPAPISLPGPPLPEVCTELQLLSPNVNRERLDVL